VKSGHHGLGDGHSLRGFRFSTMPPDTGCADLKRQAPAIGRQIAWIRSRGIVTETRTVRHAIVSDS